MTIRISSNRKGYDMKVFTTLAFSKLISIHPRTLTRWDKLGLFKACVKPSGHRFYTEQHYIDYCKQSGLPLDESVLSDEVRTAMKNKNEYNQHKTGDRE